jgi:hypothetical protein
MLFLPFRDGFSENRIAPKRCAGTFKVTFFIKCYLAKKIVEIPREKEDPQTFGGNAGIRAGL